MCKLGVVNIKRVLLLVLFITLLTGMSAVSAENSAQADEMSTSGYVNDESTDKEVTTQEIVTTEEVTNQNKVINKEVSNSEIVTKNVSDAVTKSSTNEATTKKSETSLSSQSVYYGTNTQLTATVRDANTNKYAADGKVVFKINGKTIGVVSVKSGKATINYTTNSLSPKKYTITAKYSEGSTLSVSSATAYLTVLKHNSKITLIDKTTSYKNNVQLAATVVDEYTSKYANGGKVAFKVNGKTVGYSTVSNGKAYFTYNTNSLSVKSYSLTASYGGTDLLNSDKASVKKLTITRAPSKITVSKVSGYSTVVLLKATIVDKSKSKYLTSGKVAFKVNGKTVGMSEIVDGKASVKYDADNLVVGDYTITVVYGGSKYYTEATASNTLNIKAENSFTYSQIKKSAVHLRTQFEANNIIKSVEIGSSRIGLQDFLPLMIQVVENINAGKASNSVAYKHYNSISSQVDTISTTTYTLRQMRNIGLTVLEHMQKENAPPTSVQTSTGRIGYYNIIYCYSKMVDVSDSSYLPATCKAFSWSYIHPSNPKSRPIYISSDNIFNKKTDTAYMNSIKNKLESLGFTVKILGLGPNYHTSCIWGETLPANAAILTIFGGADAGVINELGTRTFMRLKSNRLIFQAYNSRSSIDITGMSFLKRAHDDNYSSRSFTGLANPDDFLKEHGYDYIYAYDVDTIVSAFIRYIS